MSATRYTQQPVTRIGATYSGGLVRDILIEIDRQCRRVQGLLDDASGSSSGSLVGAPTNASYVTLGGNASLTSERILTGTSNQITVTDGGANSTVTLSAPQNLHTSANFQVAKLGLGAVVDSLALLRLQLAAGDHGLVMYRTAQASTGSDYVELQDHSTNKCIRVTNMLSLVMDYTGTPGIYNQDQLRLQILAPTTQSTTNVVEFSRRISSTNYASFTVLAGGGVQMGDTSSAGAAVKRLVLQGGATQSVNLFEVFSSTPTSLVSISSAGKLVLGITAPALQLTSGAGINRVLIDSDGSGNATWAAITALGTGTALTRVDDTNVTLTLGGSPTTALLAATSITVVWSGQLSLARGGTAANLTAVNGGIVYSGAAALAISAAGSTGQLLRSAGAASPTWTTATFPAAAGTSGNVLTSDGTNWSSAAPAGGSVDASAVTYTPAVLGNWNSGIDPGNVDGALDQLAGNLSPLLPPAASALTLLTFTTASGVSGRNTWSSGQAIANYANAPSDSALGADVLDATMTTSSTLHGVYDWDTFTSAVGVIAGGQAADTGLPTPSFPGNAWGPGGSDGGATNRLDIYVNNAVVHTVDLLTSGAGTWTNANGSGFILSAAIPCKFPNGTSFAPRTYRTGTWVVTKADCGLGHSSSLVTRGWTTVKIKHVTTATTTTTIHEFMLDDENTATSYSAESISAYAGAGALVLSGVTYHTSASATYNVTMANTYRNTYSSGNAISYQVNGWNGIASEAQGASGGNEALSITKNKAITATAARHINTTLSVTTTVDRTVQADTVSAGASVAGVLMDPTASTSTNTAESWDDEKYRMKSNLSLTSTAYVSGGGVGGSPAVWDSTQSLVGADAGHNTGLLVSGGQLQYPKAGANAGNFGGITNGPGGNPNYSAAAGSRTYLRYFFVGAGVQNITFTLTKDSGTSFVSVATGPSAQAITFELLAPNTTQNGSATVEFKDALVAYTTNDAIGCQSSSSGTGAGGITTTLNLTLGTRSTSTSGNAVVIRITAAAAWTGNLSQSA